MDLKEATKAVRGEKPKENYLVLEVAYDNKIVLPYKDGVAVLAALANAQRLVESYSQKSRIEALERDAVTSRIFSAAEYEQFQIAALLDITPSEVKTMMEAAKKPQTPPAT